MPARIATAIRKRPHNYEKEKTNSIENEKLPVIDDKDPLIMRNLNRIETGNLVNDLPFSLGEENHPVIADDVVLFKQGNNEYQVPLKRALQLNRFVRDLFKRDQKCYVEPEKTIDFNHFMRFMCNGTVPKDHNMQKRVVEILKIWGCDKELLLDFKERISIDNYDSLIIHNEKRYKAKCSKILDCSVVFRDILLANCMEIIVINDGFSHEAFDEFVDLMHDRIIKPNISRVDEVFDIANTYNCKYLISILSPLLVEKDLLMLLQQSKSDEDTSEIEKLIAGKVEYVVNDEMFSSLPPQPIVRILQQSEYIFSEYQMNRFLKKFVMAYGVSAIMNIPLGPFKTALQSEKSMEFLYSLPKEPNTIFSYVLQNMEKMSIELMDCKEKLLKMETLLVTK